ncbi:glycosyltransferase [Bacteroides ovatus]|uniref:glycosyltransferase n=1 Tax=Bacteroides ovatus TaxID=28116 RepID=UPI00232B224D|nr:glycosyltransferase [Bacteroides ovatus]MDC2771565.1 glycosyltransferase [Bacteroides ovatus]MDC2781686.1 glycosyltransferase [Bacteroides ovatus]MDC2786332.1 glycosyltransferase [Bacteroides ovatus]MDC2791483.1 glycosyltransferase [Bacteroides ovatus]MDC2795932.1 glycosyltransferase [Bacteroides ovatus]
MKVNAKLSIIVPIYNVEKYLDRCMQSLLKQTLRDIEIILVDDGSPDNCPNKCDSYALCDKRIKVIHKKNEGLGFARNSGLEIASGDYVAFVDSDDFVSLDMYKTLINLATKNNCDAVYCGFYKEYKQGTYSKVQECEKYTEFIGDELKEISIDFIASEPFSKMEYKHDMSVWHSIYRRKIIEDNNIRFVSERDYASEDVPFQIDFLLKSRKVAFIPDLLYTYCFNGISLTKRISLDKFEKFVALYYLLIDKTKNADVNGLRAKRLIIGNARALIRTILRSNLDKETRKRIISEIHKHHIWNEIKPVYKLNYLPFHQRIILWGIYNNKPLITTLLCKTLESRYMLIIKKYNKIIWIKIKCHLKRIRIQS